jgi:hypothetical protein
MTMISLTPRPTRIVAATRIVRVHAAVCPHAPEGTAKLSKRRLIRLVIGPDTDRNPQRTSPAMRFFTVHTTTNPFKTHRGGLSIAA